MPVSVKWQSLIVLSSFSAEDCGSSSKMLPQKKFEKLLIVVAIEVRSLSVFLLVFLNDKTFILDL